MHNTTNRNLYFALLCASVVVTLLCHIIPQDNPWFTIVAGIGCGGVASTIVAWLIEEANLKKALEKANRNREMLFSKLYASFNYGLQVLVLFTGKKLQDDEYRNWFGWVESAHQLAKDDKTFCRDYVVSMRIFFDDISEQIYGLYSQSAILLEYEIIESKDVDALSMIKSVCDLAEAEFCSTKKEEDLIDNILICCSSIRAGLDYSPTMSFINEKNLDPTVYNIYKSGI